MKFTRRAEFGLWSSKDVDAGFTLVELMIVLVIMPLVMGAVATGFIVAVKDQAGVSGRLSDSSGAQLTSAFYVRDVQSAASITTNSNSTLSPVRCGTGTQFLLGLEWGASGGAVVSYWAIPTAGSSTTYDLVRRFCTGGSATPSSNVTLASGLPSSAAAAATIAPSSASSAASSGWAPISTSGISSVQLGALESASSYNFNLLAVPRVAAAEGAGGNPAPPPLLLLGSGTNVLSCTGNGSVSVTGAVYIDSSSNGAGNLTGNASVTATGPIYTTDSTPSNSITTSGPASYSPNPAVNGPVVADPYASLTPPSTSGLPVYSDGNYHGPGVYTSTLSFSGQASQVLATGTYILEQGISVTGQGSLSSASGGVLLYVSGGSISISGRGSVNLAPLTPAPYPTAPNMGIWQASSDNNPLSLTGNGAANTYSGTIYAPGAAVSGTGNAGYTAGAIVASSLSCTGNGSINLG